LKVTNIAMGERFWQLVISLLHFSSPLAYRLADLGRNHRLSCPIIFQWSCHHANT